MSEASVDFFISYTGHDTSWAKWLDWLLREEGHTTRTQVYDFVPGKNFVDEIQSALTGCQTVICVMSKRYLSSRWCNEEWQSALKERKLLPVRIDDCETQGLLGLHAFVDLEGVTDDSAAKQRVLDAVRLRRGVGTRPPDNPGFPAFGEGSGPNAIRFPLRLPPLWSVPHARNPNFTGRDDILLRLHDAFVEEAAHALTQSVRGLGGVGKTQLALEYAYRYADEYQGVLWLRSEEPASLAAEYAALAEQLPELGRNALHRDRGVVIRAVRRALAERGRVLHVFDNAVEPAQIAPYIPMSALARVIITTRASSWPRAQGHSVRPLNNDESVALLCDRTGDADETAAREIAALVGGLPLALEQAAAYVESCGKTLRAYASLLSKHGIHVLERGKPHDYESSVGTTWAIAMSSLEDQPAARHLLSFCAFLAPDEIATEDFARSASRLPSPLDELFGSELVLDEAKAALLRFSLVRADDDTLAIHRLVQAVVRDRLDAKERRQWLVRALAVLRAVFPAQSQYNAASWPTCRRLLSHAVTTTEHPEAEQADAAATRLLTQYIGVYLFSQGQFATAEPFLRRSLEIAMRILSPVDPRLAHSQGYLAQVLADLRKTEEAEVLYRCAIGIYERTQHTGLSSRLSDLGLILGRLGRHDEGEALMRRSIMLSERMHGPTHPKVATRLINLGDILIGDRDAEREALYRRALHICEAALDPSDPGMAEALRSLGNVLTMTGRAAEAEPLLRRALAIDVAAYGDSYVRLGFDLVCLARALHKLRRSAEAEPLARRAASLLEAIFGADSPYTVDACRLLKLIADALASESD